VSIQLELLVSHHTDGCSSFDSSKDRGEFETVIGVKKVIQGKLAGRYDGNDMLIK
jgi:hypothetical protein